MMWQNLYTFLAMASPAGGEGKQQSPAFMFVWLGLMIAIFYVMLIRPQKRREKERRALLAEIKTGDRVAFSGGIIGVVTNAKEKTFSIRIAEKTKIEVARSAVTQVLGKGEMPEEEGQKR